MSNWKKLFEIGILKDDYIRLLTATNEQERLSAERSGSGEQGRGGTACAVVSGARRSRRVTDRR
jgi:hypothetical protein